jgi:acyl-CoA thioesterase YciA
MTTELTAQAEAANDGEGGERQAILRVVPRPGDINANGHIFGGWVLSQMDIVAVYAWVERIGRTSIRIRIEVFASRNRGREEVKVTEGLFTFVALDENARPRPVRRG